MNSTTTPQAALVEHIAQAVHDALNDLSSGTEIKDGTLRYTLDLVSDDFADEVVMVTAWTENKDGEDVDLGEFRLTIEPVAR